MRRWVFVFLLLVVPFQLVWGSAAPYCAHEDSVSTKKHFGHHEHQHQGGDDVATAADGGDDAPSASHVDCESCHLGCSALVPAGTAAAEVRPPGDAVTHPEPRYESHIPASPKRPDRAPAALAARFGAGVVVVSLAD